MPVVRQSGTGVGGVSVRAVRYLYLCDLQSSRHQQMPIVFRE